MDTQEILNRKDIFTTTAMALMYDRYGGEFMEWDPLTLNIMIKDDFNIIPRQVLKDRIQAGASLITTDMFYREFSVFSVTCNVMAGTGYSTEMIIPPGTDEVAWGCLEARLLDDSFSPDAFHPDIARYTGVILKEEGIFIPPSILSFADYPDYGGLDFPEDEQFQALIMDTQEKKKKDFISALQRRLASLFRQLREIESEGMNNAFIDNALEKLVEL